METEEAMIQLNEDRQKAKEGINMLQLQYSTLESQLDAKLMEAVRTIWTA